MFVDGAFVVHWMWLGLIFIGMALLFAVYYFRSQSKKLSRALSDLYRLNQSVQQDALNFFEQSWPILEQLGCLSMEADIQWFGENKQLLFGVPSNKGRRYVFNVAQDDMVFSLRVVLNRKASEPESLSFLVLKTFISILEQNLILKRSEILASQKRLERYQLFVQHEIKNIAQFIQLLCEQVKHIEKKEDKLKLVDRLKTTLPPMAERAKKTVLHMKRPAEQVYECSELQVHALLKEVLGMYGLTALILGKATVCLPRELFIEALKNVLGNFRDHCSIKQDITIHIELIKETTVSIKISAQKVQQTTMEPERLFEPFWTTSDSGMGLGLFLARELLKQMKGQIEFEQQSKYFGFRLLLPCKP